MIISLTGTPGTGKTSICSLISEQLKIDVIHVHSFAKKHDLICGFDKIRNSDLIDINKMDKILQKQINPLKLVVIDGHISHLFSCVSKIIVLRCDPNILKERLQKRGWDEKKIKENIQAEILDVILCEAIENKSIKEVFEIDTSNKNTIEISNNISSLITSDFSDDQYSVGNVDWSEFLLDDDFTQGDNAHGS